MATTHPTITLKEPANATSASVIYPLPLVKSNVQFSIRFGRPTEANADAIVGVANPNFANNSWHYGRMGSVQLSWEAGLRVFDEVESKSRALIDTDGIKTENGMMFPLGYAIAAGPGFLKPPSKGVILVNIWRGEPSLCAYDPEAVKLSIMGALTTADRENFKSLAVPALGTVDRSSEVVISLQESLNGIISGMENYFDGKATQIEKVAVIVDAQPTLENAFKMMGMLNAILRK
jgi:hypothetical protein